MNRLLTLVLLVVAACGPTTPLSDFSSTGVYVTLETSGPFAPAGLVTSTNLLTTASPGAFSQADNVVMRRPGLVESRRGYELVGASSFPGTLRNAVNFQGYVVGWGAESGGWLAYYDLASGEWTLYSGVYPAPGGALETWLEEVDGSLFVGTAKGVYRLDDVGGQPVLAGAPQGLAGKLTLTGSSGFLPPGVGVAYRVVWGYKTSDGRLVLGAPSGRFTVYNVADPDAMPTPPSHNVTVAVPLPAGINSTSFFLQVYRSQNSVDLNTPPDDELRLVYESPVTGAALASRSITFTDVDVLLSGANLYTNPSSGMSILASNYVPPTSGVAADFKGQAFFADLHGVAQLLLQFLGVGTGQTDPALSVGDTINISGTVDPAESTVTFIASMYEDPTNMTFKVFSDGSAAQNLERTAESLVRIVNAQPYYVTAHYLGDGGPTSIGNVLLLGNQDMPAAPSGGYSTAVVKPYVWVTRGTTSGPVADMTAVSPSIPRAAGGAAARDSSGAVTVSGVAADVTATLAPGEVIQIFSFAGPFSRGAKTLLTVGATSFTYLETGTAGTGQVSFFLGTPPQIDAMDQPAGVAWAPIYQPDGVPLTNYDVVGNSSARVLAMIPVEDKLFLAKEDGLWRVSGQDTMNFTFEPFDGTIRFPAPRALTVMDGKAYALTTTGVVVWDENNSPSPASTAVEQQLRELVTKYPDAVRRLAFMTAYHSEHEIHLWMPESADATAATREWVLGPQGAWTNWTLHATEALVTETAVTPYANDKLYAYDPLPAQWQAELKTLTDADYADDNQPIQVALTWIPNWGGDPSRGKQWVYWYGLPEHQAPSMCTLGFSTDLDPVRQSVGYVRDGNPDPALIDVETGLHGAALVPHLEHSVAGEKLSLKGYSAKVRPYVSGPR